MKKEMEKHAQNQNKNFAPNAARVNIKSLQHSQMTKHIFQRNQMLQGVRTGGLTGRDNLPATPVG